MTNNINYNTHFHTKNRDSEVASYKPEVPVMIKKECGHITGLLVLWSLLLLILPCPYSFSHLSRGSIICASHDIRIRVNKMSCHGIMTADLNTY